MKRRRLYLVDSQEVPLPKVVKGTCAGLGGMAGNCFVQQFDLAKTRMQMSGAGGGERQYSSTWDCLKKVVQNEGFLALYNGLSAAMLRQATYTTARMSVFLTLDDAYLQHYGQKPTLGANMLMGMFAGGIGAIFGSPAELALIRMTADGIRPESERRNYKHVFNALYRVIKEEGVMTMWRGCLPNIVRAAVCNATELATYFQMKRFLKANYGMQEVVALHIAASLVAGFGATCTSLPFDIAKTRVQNMKVIDGKPEYRGMTDVIMKVIQKEGVLGLWKGFLPTYLRIGPHTVLTFVFFEQLVSLYYRYISTPKKAE